MGLLIVGSLAVGAGDLDQLPSLLIDSRIPRTVANLLAGSGLAVSGFVVQLALRNRFVDPMICGTGQGAVLGLLFASLYFSAAPLWIQIGFSTVAALFATLGFWGLARTLSPAQYAWVPVLGLIYGGMLGAVSSMWAIHNDVLQVLEVWLTGEFSGVITGRYEWLLAIAGIVGFLYLSAQRLLVLSLGETMAKAIGLNVKQSLAICFVLVALTASLVTLTVGLLPFVGLVVPNLVRDWLGDHPKRALPACALLGATFCLGADLLSRLLVYPFEIPVSLTLGVAGALGFLVFVWRRSHA